MQSEGQEGDLRELSFFSSRGGGAGGNGIEETRWKTLLNF